MKQSQKVNMKANRKVFFVCEGKSEGIYLQEINRFFRSYDIPLVLNPDYPEEEDFDECEHKLGRNGNFPVLKGRYDQLASRYEKAVIFIMADDDLYVRNDNHNMDKLKAAKADFRDKFLFNLHNFEDFLALHHEDELVDKWIETCQQNGHVGTPLHSKQYIKAYRSLFGDYKKGELPSWLKSDMKGSISRMISHSRDRNSAPASLFGVWLYNELLALDALEVLTEK